MVSRHGQGRTKKTSRNIRIQVGTKRAFLSHRAAGSYASDSPNFQWLLVPSNTTAKEIKEELPHKGLESCANKNARLEQKTDTMLGFATIEVNRPHLQTI